MFNLGRSSPRWIVLIAAALASACNDEPPTLGLPQAADRAEILAQDAFYYYQGSRIPLDRIVNEFVLGVGPARAEIAGRALQSIGAGQMRQRGFGSRDDLSVLTVDLPTGASDRALALLNAEPELRFAIPVYALSGTSHKVYVTDRLDVTFRPSVNKAQIDSMLRALSLRVVRPPRPDSGFFAYRLALPAGGGAAALWIAQTLDRHPLVEWADNEKQTRFVPHYTPNDPLYSSQFHLRNATTYNGIPVDINVEPAWDLTRGAGVRVAIIDDGVDVYHGNTGGDMFSPWAGASGYDLVPAASEGNVFEPCCNDTHGTSVAGIIMAAQNNGTGGSGIAPDATLNAARVFRRTYPPESNSYGSVAATDVQLADAINWAWRYVGSDVINNSWGGGSPSNAITTAVVNALTQGRGGRGTVVVFSAGNPSNRAGGFTDRESYPASLSSTTAVISVGAINSSGSPTNYTPVGTIDVVAPSGHYTGACVGSVVTNDRRWSAGCNDGPFGNVDYTSTFSGTSAAAPQVSGAAALLLAYRPSLTAAQVKQRIRAGADSWGASNTFGAGKLNTYRTLTIP